MSARFFLDTNIFVYSFDRSSAAKSRRAAQLIREAVSTRKGIVSYQVVQEFFNVALRRFEQPMTEPEAEQYLSAIFRPLLAIQSSPALISEAMRLIGRRRLSWYDSLIVAAAIQGDCDIVYSEGLQYGRKIGELRIENPFA